MITLLPRWVAPGKIRPDKNCSPKTGKVEDIDDTDEDNDDEEEDDDEDDLVEDNKEEDDAKGVERAVSTPEDSLASTMGSA